MADNGAAPSAVISAREAYDRSLLAFVDAVRKEAKGSGYMAGKSDATTPAIKGVSLADVSGAHESVTSVLAMLEGKDAWKAQRSGLASTLVILQRVRESLEPKVAPTASKPVDDNPFATPPSANGTGGKGTRVEDTGPGHVSDRDAASDSAWWQEHVVTSERNGVREPRFSNPWKLAYLEAYRDAIALGVTPPVYDARAFGWMGTGTPPVWEEGKRNPHEVRIAKRFGPRVTVSPIVDDGE